MARGARAPQPETEARNVLPHPNYFRDTALTLLVSAGIGVANASPP
jgi:hypothetical protein